MAMPAEQLDARPPESFEPLELLRNGIITQRTELIPVGSIVFDEDFAIDPEHAEALGRNMDESGRQLQEIGVRARLHEDKIVYDLFDGSHRSWDRKQKGIPTIRASVSFGMTDEELLDARILAIGSAASVQFSRFAVTVSKSWKTTAFAEKGMTAAEGFAIATSKETSQPDLTRDEVIDLKAWVEDKSENRWKKSATEVLDILRIVDEADPELVKQARDVKGRKAIGVITPGRLAIVSHLFPHERHFDAQAGILRAALERNLSKKLINELCWKLVPTIIGGVNEETAYQKAMAVDRQELIEASEPARPRSSRSGQVGERVVVDLTAKRRIGELEKENSRMKKQIERADHGLIATKAELATTRRELAVAKSQLAEMQPRLAEAEAKSGSGNAHNDMGKTQAELARVKAELETAKAELTGTVAEIDDVYAQRAWWHDSRYHLTSYERDLVKNLAEGNVSEAHRRALGVALGKKKRVDAGLSPT